MKRRKRSKAPKAARPDCEAVDIDALLEDGTAIDRAVRRATRAAVLWHKKLGETIVVWQRGKVVRIKAKDIR